MSRRPKQISKPVAYAEAPYLDRWTDQLGRMRILLRELLDQRVGADRVVELIERLGALDEMYRSAAAVSRPTRRVGRDQPALRYQIEQVRGKQFLAEYRSPAQQPFRCPRETYDKFAEVLGRAEEPVAFEQLLAKLREQTSETLPDYLARMCLRFWMSVAPPLVEKVRTRYRPGRRSAFKNATHRVWTQLSQQAE